MSKRGNNEGSIYFDNARNQYRATVTAQTGRVSKRFTTRQEAQRWLTQQCAAVNANTYISPDKMSLGEWLREYFSVYIAPKVRETTLEHYQYLANHLAKLSSHKLQALTPSIVQRYFNDLDINAPVKAKVFNLLNRALTRAVKARAIYDNPMANLSPPKVPKKEISIYTDAEIKTLLSITAKDDYYHIALLAFHTGLRRGELLALRWIDLEPAAVNVRRTMQRLNGKIVFNEPKTARSRRRVTVDSSIIDQLMARPRKTDLVFSSKKNTPILPRNVTRWWLKAQKKACIPERGIHAIRHSHASMLLAAAVSPTEVSKRLGHSSAIITMMIYAHAIPNKDHEVAATANRLLNALHPTLHPSAPVPLHKALKYKGFRVIKTRSF